MEIQKQDQEQEKGTADQPSAIVIDFVPRTGHQGDPMEVPLTPGERKMLRMLMAIGPERIAAAVKALETLKFACPTARRELSTD